MMAAMWVRDAHHRAAIRRTSGPTEARAAVRTMRVTASTVAPNAPTPGSAITSIRRGRVRWGRSPSALSARPSRWRSPVRAASTATVTAAAATGGHIRPDAHHTAPTTAPTRAPTAGNHPTARRLGARAPPSGVRKARAALTDTDGRSRPPAQRQHPAGNDQQDLTGGVGDRPVEGTQGVPERPARLRRRVDTQAHLLAHHDDVHVYCGQRPCHRRAVARKVVEAGQPHSEGVDQDGGRGGGATHGGAGGGGGV